MYKYSIRNKGWKHGCPPRHHMRVSTRFHGCLQIKKELENLACVQVKQQVSSMELSCSTKLNQTKSQGHPGWWGSYTAAGTVWSHFSGFLLFGSLKMLENWWLNHSSPQLPWQPDTMPVGLPIHCTELQQSAVEPKTKWRGGFTSPVTGWSCVKNYHIGVKWSAGSELPVHAVSLWCCQRWSYIVSFSTWPAQGQRIGIVQHLLCFSGTNGINGLIFNTVYIMVLLHSNGRVCGFFNTQVSNHLINALVRNTAMYSAISDRDSSIIMSHVRC